MKRVIRLTESDLVKLVKKVIKEQQTPTSQPKLTSIPGVNLYFDQSETKNAFSFKGKIKLNQKKNGDVWFQIPIENKPGKFQPKTFIYSCATDEISDAVGNVFYNKNLSTQLGKFYCVQSSGGSVVPNVGPFSQTSEPPTTGNV